MIAQDKLCYSVPELAKVLGISRPKAYELVKRDDFPSITVGKRIIIPASALERWLDENAGA
ncbi:helix-turn-helix domain-containing protein [Butyricicoccus sp.]|uniref:helix-turn-helix domain-containing protein n=1 Tax=Butyricicoccus sp. TaxID=2049021 RepID=UPI003F17C68C